MEVKPAPSGGPEAEEGRTMKNADQSHPRHENLLFPTERFPEEAFPEDECPRCGRPLKQGLCPPFIRDIG